jgi:hypothetical protein
MQASFRRLTLNLSIVVATAVLFAGCSDMIGLRVMRTGLGSGTITGVGINCGNGMVDCNESFAPTASVMLTAAVVPGSGSTFLGWGGDCASAGTSATCTVMMDAVRSVRADFGLGTMLTTITNFAPDGAGGLGEYLMTHPEVNSPSTFIAALPQDFRQNWILMSRSESLQTGNADSPRVLMPSADAQRVFTVGMTTHSSYPGAHPNAIEYMQWDPVQKNFRFHEIVLAHIDAMGDDLDPDPMVVVPRFPARDRGVSVDDKKCFQCHSTRNVLNRGTTPGTDGIPPGSVKSKNKPNWDTYDSWGGMLAFNRDRIYQGSVEAAAFRTLFNLWTWQTNDPVRSVIEQLELQPPMSAHPIARSTSGGADDGRITLSFDAAPPPFVTTEPLPAGSGAPIMTAYEFNRAAGTGMATPVVRDGERLTLHHSAQVTSDEGRGVELFDRLSVGPNPQRIADEVANHRFATGSVPIDVRALALAVAGRCMTVGIPGGDGDTDGDGTLNKDEDDDGDGIQNEIDDNLTQVILSDPPLAASSTAAFAFFNARHGLTSFDQVFDDTRLRAWSLPRRKADIQKIHLDRTGDPYVYDSDVSTAPPPPLLANGLIQQYGAFTSGIMGGSGGGDISLARLRQEVFRRSRDAGFNDHTVMGGIMVDREVPGNSEPLSLFRYFLEPLGVSVDKWSMGVRGRSRTYTFADLFGGYTNTIATEMKASLGISLALPSDQVCDKVIPLVDATLASLPPADDVPKFTDLQRIFNKGCIECHGGLGYPPFHTYGTFLDLSEDENPPMGARRMTRSYDRVMSYTSAPVGMDVSNSYLFNRITDFGFLAHPYKPDEPYNMSDPDDPADPDVLDERCPFGLMPCGGPPLNTVDIETIRRWILGGRSYTEGDPHIKTVDNVNYDFQSAGEFVLLRDEGMELQARQTAVTTAGPLGPNGYTGLSSCVSVNTAVALRVGRHRVSYQPTISRVSEANVRQRLVLRVDGKETALAPQIPLPSGGRIVRTTAAEGIEIQYPGGTSVTITPAFWQHHQIWYMNINVQHARATDGVMGTIASGNWLPALPDGTLLGPRPASLAQRYQDLYERFADAWRVTGPTSLFDYESGLSTTDFTVDSWPMESPQSCTAPAQPGVPQVSAAPTPVTPAEAEKLCSAIAAPDRRANCIVDVTATGDRGFAETYQVTERLENRPIPAAPALGFPDDNADLSRAVDFRWTRDVDVAGGPVTYRHCVWNADQPYDLNKCVAVANEPPPGRGMFNVSIVLIVAALLFLALLMSRVKHRRFALAVVAILIIPAVFLAIYLGNRGVDSTIAATSVGQLQAGKVYFWKVIAENSQGGVVESRTRRFTVR